MSAAVPSSLGKYRLLDRIGAGAMGEVYRAHDSVLDRPVALKIIVGGDEERRQRFRREAQSAARLTHPNIVVVHDFGEDSGRFFMAMELLEGTDLKGAIVRNLLPELRSRLLVMEQICEAVGFAHATNIVHRDLKPANVFLLPNGQVKILDFGLARVGHSSMTGTGTVLGTPNYMAPEQIKGQRVDARCDIFALGAVFYELLSGQKAFDGSSLHSVLYRVLQYEPQPLRVVAPAVPPAVSDIVSRSLMKDPAQRFANVAELRNAIRSVREAAGFVDVGLPSMSVSASMEGISGQTLIARDGVEVQSVAVSYSGELGSDITVSAAAGQTILEISLENNIAHAHACGGSARCSTCRVAVLSGMQNLSPRNAEESKLAKRLNLPDDVRLACQTRVGGSARVRRLIRDDDDVSLVRSDSGGAVRAVGREVPLAVLYATTRDTTALLRKQLAHDVVHILNRYYAQVADAVFVNGGQLARYDGTTLVALFGLESDDARAKCTAAVRTSLRMQKRMEIFNGYLAEHFGLSMTLDIGLHYGRMISGHLGHPEQARLTAFGEPVNIAANIAAQNAQQGTRILAAEELINIVEGQVSTGTVVHEPRTLYEIVDFAKPDTYDLVQTSFELVAARKEEAAELFYRRLFEIAPEVRPLFAKTDIRVQGQMLMNMLAAAVRGLDRIEELKPALIDLGRRHASYGVAIPHYAVVEACLLSVVETLAGPAFNIDVKLAWTEIYNFIAQTMIEASA